MKRRILSVLLALMMVVGLLPMAALASEGEAAATTEYVAEIDGTGYATLRAAKDAAKDGDTIKLLKDIDMNVTFLVNGKTLTLDMNGHKLYNTVDLWSNSGFLIRYSIISVTNKGNLTITGNGTVEAKENDCYAVDVQDGSTLTIENGAFVGNIHAVYVQEGTAYIKGGTYSVQQKYTDSAKADEFVLNLLDENRENGTAKMIVTGGTFANFNPANCWAEGANTNFCASGYETVKSGSDDAPVWTVEDHRVAEIDGVGYASLSAAVTAANDGDTITLLKDATGCISVPAGKTLTLDLGGHKLSNNNYALDVYGNLTVKNGTVATHASASIWVNDGGTFTLEADATVKAEAGCFCVAVWGTSDQPNVTATITIKGTLDGGSGLTVNGTINAGNTTITVADGAKILGDANGSVGLYLAGKATTTVGNAEIVCRDSAVEIRAGELEITSGKFTATAVPTSVEPNGNGTTSAGAAIAVAQHTTKQEIDVKISGGEFNGYSALYESNPQKNSADDIAKVHLSVAGGKFAAISGGTQAVYSQDCTGFITGGYFTTDPSGYKAADCFVVASDVDGYTYMVTDTAPTDDNQKITVVDKTEAAVGSSITGEDKTAIDAVKDKANVDGVAEAVRTDVKTDIVNDAKGKANNVPTGETTSTEIEVKVNVSVTEANLTEGSMTFEAKPVATVKVNGNELKDSGDKAVEIPVSNAMLSGKAITVKLPLPTVNGNLFTPKEIKHISENGSVEYFINETEEAKRGAETFKIVDDCAVFEITHFSTFVLSGTVTYVEPAPAYQVSVAAAENGAVTASRRSASRGQTVTLTVAPEAGYQLDTLTVTDRSGNAVELTDKGNGTYTFVMPASRVTVTATFKKAPVFTDAGENNWYTAAILWAAEKGVALDEDGSGLFRPFDICTRADMVTFLWRVAGSPEPTIANPFTDVSESDPWYKAALWACETGVTKGYGSHDVFAPNAVSSRAQTVLFLQRAVKGADVAGDSFTDVPAGYYYEGAVYWALQNEVTKGYGDSELFGPENDCNRAEIITFIYRLYNK